MKNFKRVLSLALALLMVIGGLVVAPVDAKAADTYTKVTSIDEITTTGGNYVVVVKSEEKYHAMRLDVTTGNFIGSVEVTIDGDSITAPGGFVPVWTIKRTNNDTFTLENQKGYLGYKSSLKVQISTSNNEWNISGSNGEFTIAPSSITDGTAAFAFNPSTPRFKPYNPNTYTSGVFGIMLYKFNGTTVNYPSDISALPSTATDEEIVAAAYKAKYNGVTIAGTYELEGVIKKDVTVASGKTQATVDITIGDKTVSCYNLNCGSITSFVAGDSIVVEGTLGHYGDTVQLAGTLKEYKEATNVPTYDTTKEIYEAATELTDKASLPGGPYTLEGVVTSIEYLYSTNYGVSFNFEVDGYSFYCYNLHDDGADKIEKGDTVKLTGTITKHGDLIELTSGTIDKHTVGTHEAPKAPADSSSKAIVDALYALDNGKSLPGGPYTLTGKITKIVTAYTSENGYVTVNIQVEGKEIQCYKLTGTGIDKLALEDEITVKGELKRYNKTYEFDAPTLVPVTTEDGDNSGSGSEPESGSQPESGNEPESGSQPESGSGSESDKKPTQKEIVDAAFKLGAGEYLGGSKESKYTLTGEIISVEKVTVDQNGKADRKLTIKVEGKEILCYFLKGSEADITSLEVGNIITVTGPIKNYVDKAGISTIEFERPELVKINATGDFSNAGTVMILVAGIACLAVAFVSKKKMA